MTQSIHLQGIGQFQAKKAKDIVIGEDYLVWNFGLTSKPVDIVKQTPKQIVFLVVTPEGNVYERRLNKERLVAFTTKEKY